MFDANMRYIKAGRKFFGKVHQCDEGSLLYGSGVRKDDIIICEMMTDGHENPTVRFHLKDDKKVEFMNDHDFYKVWVIYEGRIDGTDFINENSRKIAMKILENNQ